LLLLLLWRGVLFLNTRFPTHTPTAVVVCISTDPPPPPSLSLSLYLFSNQIQTLFKPFSNQAQTIANYDLAVEQGLTVIPVVTKIDLPNARPDDVILQLCIAFGLEPGE
jgi:hypothetical protein